MKLLLLPLVCSLAALAAATAPQSAVSAEKPQPASTGATLEEARRLVRDRYVLPETGRALEEALAKAERAGAFRGLVGAPLAEAIQRTLRTVTPDGHLQIHHDPAQAAILAERKPAAPGQDAVLPPVMQRMIALNNGGVRKLEVLPGNVRYLEYTGFSWGAPAAEQAIAQAAAFLSGGSAIIIDLRRNGGGDARAVAALASYFLPAGTELMRFEERGSPVERTKSLPAPFGLGDRPVYVLMSDRSFSAAEEFLAHAEAFGFATLVGEPTRGGGFNNTFYPLPGGFVLSVSTGKAIHAKTGTSWEQTGIKPAIAVAQDRALDAAMAAALAALGETAEGSEKAALAALKPYYAARVTPQAPAHPLAGYVGQYGPLAVRLGHDGGLMATTPTGPSALVALGGDTFAPESQPQLRVDFTFAGDTASSVTVATPGGPQTFPRS